MAALAAALAERERRLAVTDAAMAAAGAELAASRRQTESAVNQLRDAQFALDRAEVLYHGVPFSPSSGKVMRLAGLQ